MGSLIYELKKKGWCESCDVSSNLRVLTISPHSVLPSKIVFHFGHQFLFHMIILKYNTITCNTRMETGRKAIHESYRSFDS